MNRFIFSGCKKAPIRSIVSFGTFYYRYLPSTEIKKIIYPMTYFTWIILLSKLIYLDKSCRYLQFPVLFSLKSLSGKTSFHLARWWVSIEKYEFKRLIIKLLLRKKKSQNAKSDEYAGWGTTGILLNAENVRMKSAEFTGALSWCENYDIDIHTPSRLRHTLFFFIFPVLFYRKLDLLSNL